MEDTLFGVEKGSLTSFSMQWSQKPDGTEQRVDLTCYWEHRKATYVYVYVPDDQQISHYIALWMPVLMNGSWMHKVRLSHLICGLMDKCRAEGATVDTYGTSLRRL